MYVTNEQSRTPIFQINQHIGDDKDIIEDGVVVQKGDGMGIDGVIFANEVLSFNDSDVDKLLFYVNSQGGDVQKSLDMFNSISMSEKKTHAIITGFAFSCAGWIPLAADKVDMVEETGKWMCHMPYNPENPDEKSQFMDEVVDIISKTIASKSGKNGKKKKTQEEIKKLMLEKVYWNAQRMYDEGLIDNKVNSNGKIIRLVDDPITLNKTQLNFFYKEYQSAQNKFAEDREFGTDEEIKLKNKINSKNQNNMSFPKLVNRLNKFDQKATGFAINLTEDSSEEVILDTIVRLENRLRAMNDDMMDKEKIILDSKKTDEEYKKMIQEKESEAKDARKSADDKEKEHAEMKLAYDKMCMENKEMKEKEEASNKEKSDADLKFRKERATNYVEKLIAQGKVVASDDMPIEKAKEYLINKATDNYEDVATHYSLMPVKLSGPKPKMQMKNGETFTVSSIEKLHAENRERILKSQFRTENGVKVNLYP